MDGRTDIQKYGRTENIPILQDFVPYWGRCPKAKLELLDGQSKWWASTNHSLAFPKGKGKGKVGGDDYLALP